MIGIVIVSKFLKAGGKGRNRRLKAKIPWAEVPERLRVIFEASLPGMEVSEVTCWTLRREVKYKLRGNYRGRPARAEIECDGDGVLEEIEFDALEKTGSPCLALCEWEALPAPVQEHVGVLIGSQEEGEFEPSMILRGGSDDSACFKIKGRTSSWRWEFEMLGDGTLLELEKKVRTA